MPDDNAIVGFTEPVAQALVDSIRVEEQTFVQGKVRAQAVIGSGGAAKVSSTGITARSGSGPYTWGTGTAYPISTSGVVSGSASLTIKNTSTQTAAANDIIQYKTASDGTHYWDVADCPTA